MQNLSGSIEYVKGQLTPFELAEYNVAKFTANVTMNYELNELLDRIAFLEDLKVIAQNAITGSLSDRDRKDMSAIEKEIATSELSLQIFCDLYTTTSEA